jgi:hypothetical protein
MPFRRAQLHFLEASDKADLKQDAEITKYMFMCFSGIRNQVNVPTRDKCTDNVAEFKYFGKM